MNSNTRNRSGAALIVAVLVLVAVAVLLGLGRLAAFRRQVALRLDREREIQQSLATRAVMRWLVDRTRVNEEYITTGEVFPSEKIVHRFPTVRGEMMASAVPAEPLFPRPDEPTHFNAGVTNVDYGTYERFVVKRFREGAPKGSLMPGLESGYVRCSFDDAALEDRLEERVEGKRGIVLGSENNETGTVAWLTVDLHTNFVDGVLWTDDFFGRRYTLGVGHICMPSGVSDGDRLRFGLTPLGEPLTPSSSDGEGNASRCAIWLEEQVGTNALSLSLFAKVPATGERRILSGAQKIEHAQYSPGFQLADRFFSLIVQHTQDVLSPKPIMKTVVVGTTEMEDAFVADFTNACVKAGGIRLSVELEIVRPRENETAFNDLRSTFQRIAVTPAYEYSVELAWPEERNGGDVGVTREISTVCRIDPNYRVPNPPDGDSIITYDTHGTEATRKRQARDERAVGLW